MTTTLDILRKAEEAVERATEEAKRTRLEEDRKFIIASLSEDIVNIMRPLMGQMLEGYKTTIEQFMEAIKIIPVTIASNTKIYEASPFSFISPSKSDLR